MDATKILTNGFIPCMVQLKGKIASACDLWSSNEFSARLCRVKLLLYNNNSKNSVMHTFTKVQNTSSKQSFPVVLFMSSFYFIVLAEYTKL